jgi:tetratricopeptide (TPR) repeat protein
LGTTTFVGRKDELHQLHQLLQPSNASKTAPVAIAAAAGMGGVGKTELAWQYIQQHRDEYAGGIWWLSASFAVSQLVSHAQRMGLPEPGRILATEAELVKWYYDKWVKALPEGVRLLVFDDVAEYKAIKGILPSDGRFRVLLTTRVKLGKPVQRLDLGVLKRAAAFRLLRRLVEDDERIAAEVQAAKELCEWVGWLPLGIELLGRYLANRPTLELATLLERLKEQKLKAKAMAQVPEEMPYGENLQAAFELSWQPLSPQAKQLAGLLSVFALAPIAKDWVVACLPEWEEEEIEEGLEGELVRGSLLSVDLTPQPPSLRGKGELESPSPRRGGVGEGSNRKLPNCHQYLLHALMREFFAAKLETELQEVAEELRHAVARVMVAVARQIPQTVTLGVIAQVEAALPHLEVVAQSLTPLLKDDEDPYWPFTGLVRVAEAQSRWLDAEYWSESCLNMAERRFGANHPDTATSLNNLAGLYTSMGRYSEAEPLYLQTLAIFLQSLGETHPHTQTAWRNFRYLVQQAVQAGRAAELSDHPATQAILNQLIVDS